MIAEKDLQKMQTGKLKQCCPSQTMCLNNLAFCVQFCWDPLDFFQFCGCIICHFPCIALPVGTPSVAPGAAMWVSSPLLLGPGVIFSLLSHKEGLEWQGGAHRAWIWSTERCCPAGGQELGKLRQRKLGRDERGR